MAPYTVNTTSSSEDEDAPEAFSLAQSKQYAETQDDALKKFQAKEKQRQKDRNRERDRKLKERAEKTKNTKKLEERDDVQARMERSMQNAEEEMDDEGEVQHGSDGEDDIEGSENDMSTEESEYEGMELSADKEDHAIQSDHESEGESDGGGFVTKQLQANPRRNPQHLPDHLFASAFTPKTHPSTSKTQSLASTSRRIDNVRRQKHKVRGKDLIVGYVYNMLSHSFLLLI